jgi:phage-related minor tail protein
VSDTSLVFNLVARERVSETLGTVREKFDAAAAGIATGIAGALGAGVAAAMDMSAANSKLAAQLGVGPEKAASLAKVTANVYSNAWGDSVETVNEAIRGVYQNIGDTSTAKGGLEGLTTKALALAETFDQEVGPTTVAVGQMVKTGLAKNADEAFDILAKGFQTGANKADDLLDTFNEYSTQFRDMGIDGRMAMGIIGQGLKGGARDADVVADAMKELNIRIKDGKSAAPALKTLGLSAKDMAAAFNEGGPKATKALDTITDKLRAVKDPTERFTLAQQLLGTQSEDLSKALFAIDPSAAVGSLGQVDGAMDKTAKTIENSPARALEKFKRTAMTKLAEVGGGFVKFAMENQGVFKPLAYTLAGLAATVLVVKAAMITYSAVSSVVTAANAAITWSGWGVMATWVRMNVIGLMAYARIAAGAVASALATAAAWTGSALLSIATWTARVVWSAVTATARYALMAARAVAWATVTAAQWLIAMGPVGWVIATIIALTVLIIAKWDTIKSYTGAAWGWVWSKVKGAVAGVIGAVRLLSALPGLVSGYFGRMKTSAASKATALVTYMRGLPGRIKASLGSLGSILVSKGVAVVQGLWSGIKSMAGWIKSKILGWAKSAIPGPIAKALGIASPSKVTRAQGRWIARGLVDGLTGSTKQIKSASLALADIVADALAPGKKRSKALSKISVGSKALMRLAGQEAAVATRMKAANKRISDLIKDRDKLAADVRKGVLDAANITQSQGAEGPTTAASILTGLQDKLAQAQRFAADLAQLRKKGVRGDLIQQIAQAGVEQGSAAAAALAQADKLTIKQINSTQGSLVSAADRAGSVAGDAMYGAGINAARGIVKGLKKEQASIEKQMLKIARGMQSAIKKALGIRSPSTLMADEVGRFIPPGVVAGMKQTTPLLETAMRGLVKPELAAPSRPLTAAGMAPLMGGQAGGGVVRIRLDVTGADGDMKKLIRKMVRVDGRGSVQILTGSH